MFREILKRYHASVGMSVKSLTGAGAKRLAVFLYCNKRLRPTAGHENNLKDAVGPPWVAGDGDDQCRVVGRQRDDVQRPAGNDGIAGA